MCAVAKFTAVDRFGERAVKLGFATEEQVESALEVQKKLARRRKPHRLIGLILLEVGAIDNAQLLDVLKTYEEDGEPAD